ncbi:MAG: N-acetyltransferase [Pseudomonadota bacterium]
MPITSQIEGQTEAIAALFERTFTASEGPEEGAVIETLVRAMLTTVDPVDLRVFADIGADGPTGCILFSRMRYAEDPRTVFLLSPVAVAPEAQSQGLGQRLITHGLSALRAEGADVALTYGSPGYYARTGFGPVTEAVAPAPQPLQFPHGWLGQSLTDTPLTPLKGTPTCAAPFDDPALW